ncbi:MAG: hypothetical protein ACHQD9_09110, partial [Chitinophagales bacterium]
MKTSFYQTSLATLFLVTLSLKSLEQSADVQWQKTLGGTGNDVIQDMYPLADGNYLLMGIADSSNGDVNCDLKGQHDVWVVKIDSLGNILWQQCYGGSKEEANPYN